MNRQGSSNGEVGTVFIVFLILKLTHVISWSWWWVTSPLWITGAFILAVLILTAGFLTSVRSHW